METFSSPTACASLSPDFSSRVRRWGRHAALLVVPLLILSACATPALQSPEVSHQAALGTVTIVAAERMPELRFEGFAHGKGEGAAIGAGETFVTCLSGIGSGGCSGPECGAALVLMLWICGIAGLIGGAAGASAAPAVEEVTAAEAALAHVFEVRTIQQALRSAIEDAARAAGVQLVELPGQAVQPEVSTGDYRTLAVLGVDTVVETALTRAGTAGFGINEPSTAYLEAQVRLIDTADNRERFSARYRYEGQRRTLAGWSAGQAQPLLDELDTGFQRLGAHIYDNVFELYPFPDRGFHSAGGVLSVSFGLAPLRPHTRGQLTGDLSVLGSLFEWVAADSLQPRLEWQAFPRTGDIAAAPDDMARVRNVTYDLVIAREENLAPAEIVYRRNALPQPTHNVGIRLRPGTRYFWTVRARFELDGRTRVTQWGATDIQGLELTTSPSRYSYRFRTPTTQ